MFVMDQPPAAASKAATPFGFGGGVIGDDLARWRASARQASCEPPAARMVACHAPDQQLGGMYYARNLTYRFLDGRLAQIAFNTSIDGFAFAVAKLKQAFAEPNAIVRDRVRLDGATLAHVTFTWTNGRSTIVLSDPAFANQLEVKITLDAAAALLKGPA